LLPLKKKKKREGGGKNPASRAMHVVSLTGPLSKPSYPFGPIGALINDHLSASASGCMDLSSITWQTEAVPHAATLFLLLGPGHRSRKRLIAAVPCQKKKKKNLSAHGCRKRLIAAVGSG